MSCAICETRKPRRFCPGVRGDICALCCGTEREVSVACPFGCEYLQEARKHETPPELKEEDLPNRDIEISDRFLSENDALVTLVSRLLLEAAADVPGAVDSDVREAMVSLIRTHRTLETGLYYESRPNNPLAAGIQQGFQSRMIQARQEMARRTGVNSVRDATILGALVFLERMALSYDNRRSRGRSFLHFLYDNFSTQASEEGAPPSLAGGSSLIVP